MVQVRHEEANGSLDRAQKAQYAYKARLAAAQQAEQSKSTQTAKPGAKVPKRRSSVAALPVFRNKTKSDEANQAYPNTRARGASTLARKSQQPTSSHSLPFGFPQVTRRAGTVGRGRSTGSEPSGMTPEKVLKWSGEKLGA